jgi:hypothetical protein
MNLGWVTQSASQLSWSPKTMEDVPFDLQALRVILYDKDHPKWGDKLRNDITKALEATIGEPVEAVPTMFRKKVKSQVPSDSGVSLRLSTLERRLSSLESKSIEASSSDLSDLDRLMIKGGPRGSIFGNVPPVTNPWASPAGM